MGVAYHQQSNGRVENRNKMLKTFLLLYVSKNLDRIQLLPMGEFALNAQLGETPQTRVAVGRRLPNVPRRRVDPMQLSEGQSDGVCSF